MTNESETSPTTAITQNGGGAVMEPHQPYTDDGLTYCGWDKHGGCGEVWPCSTVRQRRAERGDQ